ncbi:MAG: hypothetical protein H6698_06665 [Myxococcales bacterium]|nr:hypothetical protein [Myxococcales bacterium]
MSRFSELLTSLEDAAAAAARLEDKLDRLVDGRPPTPLVRGAILAAADELAAEGKRCQTARPRDVIEDEWTEPVFVSLREAIHGVAGRRAAPTQLGRLGARGAPGHAGDAAGVGPVRRGHRALTRRRGASRRGACCEARRRARRPERMR